MARRQLGSFGLTTTLFFIFSLFSFKKKKVTGTSSFEQSSSKERFLDFIKYFVVQKCVYLATKASMMWEPHTCVGLNSQILRSLMRFWSQSHQHGAAGPGSSQTHGPASQIHSS